MSFQLALAQSVRFGNATSQIAYQGWIVISGAGCSLYSKQQIAHSSCGKEIRLLCRSKRRGSML